MIKWLKSLFKTQKQKDMEAWWNGDPEADKVVDNMVAGAMEHYRATKNIGKGRPVGTPNKRITIRDLPISTDIARPLSPAGVTNCGEYVHPGMLRYLCPTMFSADDVEFLWVIVRDERTQMDYKTRVVDLVKATLTKLEAECHITKQI